MKAVLLEEAVQWTEVGSGQSPGCDWWMDNRGGGLGVRLRKGGSGSGLRCLSRLSKCRGCFRASEQGSAVNKAGFWKVSFLADSRADWRQEAGVGGEWSDVSDPERE